MCSYCMQSALQKGFAEEFCSLNQRNTNIGILQLVRSYSGLINHFAIGEFGKRKLNQFIVSNSHYVANYLNCKKEIKYICFVLIWGEARYRELCLFLCKLLAVVGGLTTEMRCTPSGKQSDDQHHRFRRNGKPFPITWIA